ncbi:MAG: ATP-binding cassette domain-containing protein [Mycoplasmataceae bacterium]|jgi:energy-coupling factor transport system ATP-binding protein|nr:ATP-binding cassette domain-containing protein [Mycoplasmataceae bacterium]
MSKIINTAIELENFSVIFNENKKQNILLKDLNYKFEKGKIHYIIGPSGAGKTVLISHFNGLMTSKYGKIKIFDKLIKTSKRGKVKNVKQIRKQVGLVFQFAEYQLFKTTIENDIIFGPLNFKVKKEEAKKRAKKYLNSVGLNETFLQRNPFELSGGQKRRVAISGILAIEPEILIFDEPTAGLDPQGEKEMMEIMKNIRALGKTVIVVTHSINQAMEISDNVVVIGNQKILKDGDIYDIFNDKKLVESMNLSVPHIYQIVDMLIVKDKKYKKLLELKPKTIEQLANDINFLKGKHETK